MPQLTDRPGFDPRAIPAAVSVARARLARSMPARVLVLLAVGAVGAWAADRAVARAEFERRAWGESAEAWVAVVDHEPGDALVVERRQLPVAVRPPSAWAGDPQRVVVRSSVAAGEIVVSSDVVGDVGPQALAPPGSVVVPVADPLVSVAEPGTGVRIVGDGVVLAAGGLVTWAADGVVHVAVPADEAPMVAAAVSQSTASLLFLPPHHSPGSSPGSSPCQAAGR